MRSNAHCWGAETKVEEKEAEEEDKSSHVQTPALEMGETSLSLRASSERNDARHLHSDANRASS